ncbi:hypothetical protein [Streptomyces sp. NPDC091219]
MRRLAEWRREGSLLVGDGDVHGFGRRVSVAELPYESSELMEAETAR